MKHAAILIIAAAAAAALCACGGGDEPTSGADTGYVFARTDIGPLPDAGAPEPDVEDDAATVGDEGAALPDTGTPDTGPADAGEDAAGGFEYPCEPLSVESCVTGCGSAGDRKCLKQWGPCVPPAEFCGNCADDDCDGLVNEGCPPNPECDPEPPPECSTAVITIAEGSSADTGTTLHLSAEKSVGAEGPIVKWQWSVSPAPGSSSKLQPSADVQKPAFLVDVAGTYLFSLDVWDEAGNKSCTPAQAVVTGIVYPPADPEVGCADGEREGFLDQKTYTHIAGCSGAWTEPGVTPDWVVPACALEGGDDGANPEGTGCAAADLCAKGWHICQGKWEVAAKSPTGCAGASPPDAKPKSLMFACAQPSENGSVCGDWGAGFNDVFGCGNLGTGLDAGKNCDPLDRVLASTSPNSCGFNEAEPPHGPWECLGPAPTHLNEGKVVTKKGCPKGSCSYDGYPQGSSDKGGVLCCRDDP